MHKIQVFAINMPNRTDRKANLISEFAGRDEFNLTIVPAIVNKVGAIGLWQTICQIIRQAYAEEADYVLLCEDDHVFTTAYAKSTLYTAIDEAIDSQADILLGGVSWLTTCLPIRNNLYWVEKFSGLQFTVIFRKFYHTILGTSFQKGDAADYKLSTLSEQIYLMHPFISIQKDFGYSDVTPKNNATNRVENLFKDAAGRVEATDQAILFYRSTSALMAVDQETIEENNNITISTYVIMPQHDGVRKQHIRSQFEHKPEFDVRIVRLYQSKNTTKAYWQTVKGIIKQAIAEDDDVIIICDDDHQFTETYSKDNLIWHIVGASQLGTGILCGGVDDFETAIPVVEDKFWIHSFCSSPFIVLYRTVFDTILQQPFVDHQAVEELYREVTSNKMMVFPFFSERRRFDNTTSATTNSQHGAVVARLDKIKNAAKPHGRKYEEKKESHNGCQ